MTTQARGLVRIERMSAAEYRSRQREPKPRKYRNEPVVIDGIRFDSQAEGKRWCQLLMLEKAGVIYNLRRQVWHELKAANGAIACRYRADLEAAPPSILDRSASVVAGFLDHARTEEARIVNEIARLSEQLRQTRLAISAFEPALKVLDEGYDPADDARKSYDVAIEAKRKAKEAA